MPKLEHAKIQQVVNKIKQKPNLLTTQNAQNGFKYYSRTLQQGALPPRQPTGATMPHKGKPLIPDATSRCINTILERTCALKNRRVISGQAGIHVCATQSRARDISHVQQDYRQAPRGFLQKGFGPRKVDRRGR